MNGGYENKPVFNNDDLINRQAVVDRLASAIRRYPNECYKNFNVYENEVIDNMPIVKTQ